jgi:hypothetical protein
MSQFRRSGIAKRETREGFWEEAPAKITRLRELREARDVAERESKRSPITDGELLLGILFIGWRIETVVSRFGRSLGKLATDIQRIDKKLNPPSFRQDD